MFYTVKALLQMVVQALQLLILIRCILSFFPVGGSELIVWLHRLTDPVLLPIRRITDKYTRDYAMPVDISPLIAILLLSLISRLVIML